ncbi:Zinc dependent phospholipase C [Mucilaginibacter mallensis]|uniref:Zinc dependent phospholipase C n=1 Tax=Mucilaginibacter mallensis TaxID=652787 RepID=A0A1H1QM37_MUCMA|nr:zinc dependent phospholipase C family protein [Mucilaginibacter mallensis]SDS24532.1 Zinc dependent phospholipase C [Mucilaginibacter mallensis]
MKPLTVNRCLLILVVVLFLSPLSSKAYSVLTHEAVVDAGWQKYIRPLLKKKYPAATDSELHVAHSYAYGGCMIADMGYFPFGSKYFTNLAHYVRTGDFVMALLSESQNLNEYAFSIGALSHYMADKYGHSLGTNYAVPIMYNKVGKKYGKVATYEDNRVDHSRVEISFDVLQIARGNYPTQAYHDFIGFNVAKPVLERAFLKTYGQDINVVFGDLDLAISTFRWAVRSLLPTLTRSAWVMKKNDIKKLNPSATSKSFHYKMKKKDYRLEFGKTTQKATFEDDVIALFIEILPKVGPLRVLRIKEPDSTSEKLFIASFDTVSMHYAHAVVELQYENIKLANIDFDTGKPIKYGEYNLTDKTYDEMVDKLKDNKFENLTQSLKTDIIGFYNSADTSQSAKANPAEWKKTYLALQGIKQATPVKIDSLKTAKGLSYKTQ